MCTASGRALPGRLHGVIVIIPRPVKAHVHRDGSWGTLTADGFVIAADEASRQVAGLLRAALEASTGWGELARAGDPSPDGQELVGSAGRPIRHEVADGQALAESATRSPDLFGQVADYGPDSMGSSRGIPHAMRMHYNGLMFKAVRDSDWSANHIAAHDVTLDEVREAILERPWAFVVTARDMTDAEKKTFRRKAR